MGKGIRADLRARFEQAHKKGTCLIPESPSDAKRLLRAFRRGDVFSPAPRIYALPSAWDTLSCRQRELQKLRALAALHPTWVFAEASAAVLHGMYVPNRLMGTIHLATTPKAHSSTSPDVDRILIADDTFTNANGIAVTSLTRTAFDCMRNYDFCSSIAIGDSTLRLLSITSNELVERFQEYHESHREKSRAVETAALCNELSESGGESIARAKMIQHGFMTPVLQQRIDDPVEKGRWFRVDFFWSLPDGCVIGELDGRQKYVDPAMTNGRSIVDVMADERLRESHLSATGAKVMRFSFADVLNTRKFVGLLTSFGIPRDQAVPPVADLSDVVNFDLHGLRPRQQRLSVKGGTLHVQYYDLTKLRRRGVIKCDGRIPRDQKRQCA